MKHYTTSMSGWEFARVHPRMRRIFGGKAEQTAKAKRVYRQRERRAIDRMVEEMVVEELTQSSEELRFLWGKYKEWREYAESSSYSFSAETWG